MPRLSKVHEKVEGILWRIGIVIHCHQRPERSFFFEGRQVPICARCFGMLIVERDGPLPTLEATLFYVLTVIRIAA
jgi:uncharacterized membrane protein